MLLLVLFSSSVLGFGSTFLKDGVLELESETIGEFCFYLQNTKNESTQQQIKIIEGRNLITNIEQIEATQRVEANTRGSDHTLCMEISLPDDSRLRDEHKISYSVQELPRETFSEDLVQIQPITIQRNFVVKHIGESPRTYLLEGMIVGLFLAGSVLLFKGNQNEKRRRTQTEEKE